MGKVFLSYCHDDQEEVQQIRDELSSRGFDVWWDDVLLGGQDWKQEVAEAIRESKAVVACFSQRVQERERTQLMPELREAITVLKQLPPGRSFLIPIRLSECVIPDLRIDATTSITDLHYIDLFPPESRPNSMSKLVSSLHAALGRKNSTESSGNVEQSPAGRPYRVGEDNLIDDATTNIVVRGDANAVADFVALLNATTGVPVRPPYDHGDGTFELMVATPLSSRQLSHLSEQCGVQVKSIDHLPRDFFEKFTYDLGVYLRSKNAKKKSDGK
ncbi:toll/interleukin-1 receptor domain-containing protein [Roseimaritima ulvae]|uniref:TIR domain-containing protein n=1 Tax=Roseimaritima ulvae TaxID=980254 RepID=A0A5B9QZX1_9BACT|nr:toll/interleukin-1 receptor domain-containing protein [Roseimaritima ulvae]QEG43549.1 hypothetical protein UC8_56000 [Roseimaritima ulvae]